MRRFLPALLVPAALTVACSDFDTRPVTAADLDGATLQVKIVGWTDPREIGGVLRLAGDTAQTKVCPDWDGMSATVDGHALQVKTGGVGQVLAGSGSGGGLVPGTVEGCIDPGFGYGWGTTSESTESDDTVPVRLGQAESTIEVGSALRHVTMKLANMYEPRHVTVRSASPGQVRRGETVSLVLNVETDHFDRIEVVGFDSDAGEIGFDPWSSAGTHAPTGEREVSFQVPADWPLGKGKLSARYEPAPKVVSCEGVATCEAVLSLVDEKLDLEVLP